MKRIVVQPRIRACYGHPWIYRNEIVHADEALEPGEIVDIFTSNGVFLGRGYYNPGSKISLRILTRRYENIGKDFLVNRFKKALSLRKPLLHGSNACRVVFSEADDFPGLIVDLFDRWVVVQINTLGVEKLRSLVIDALLEVFEPQGIFDKSDASSRKKEGLNVEEGWVYGKGPELLPFELNGLKFYCDTRGQKTGFYLDQRWNAKVFGQFATGKVLDAFSYTGNFGIHALAGGADHVTFLDYSERALEIAKENLKLNELSLEKAEFIQSNAFDYLKSIQGAAYYDAISLDPPSLAKSSRSLDSALRGYKELNLRAMKLLRNDGKLLSSSCTRIVTRERFEDVLNSAAKDTKTDVIFIYHGGQPPDHPVKQSVPETFYLKSYLMIVHRE